jgi:hypothetical protein
MGGCGLETVSLSKIVKEGGRISDGMCCVCVTDKDTQKKTAVNSATVHSVCLRTVLTDISSDSNSWRGKS